MNHGHFKIKNIVPNGSQNNSTLKKRKPGRKTTIKFPHLDTCRVRKCGK
jgi:hypothetical protein